MGFYVISTEANVVSEVEKSRNELQGEYMGALEPSWVYIMANSNGSTLYIGVTTNLQQRAWQHREHVVDGFTSRYNVEKLVYVEEYSSVEDAIEREKQLKRWSRKKKQALIETLNPEYRDLYETLC